MCYVLIIQLSQWKTVNFVDKQQSHSLEKRQATAPFLKPINDSQVLLLHDLL